MARKADTLSDCHPGIPPECGQWVQKALLALFLLIAAPAQSATDLSVICDSAATRAARETGVPLSVLQAISLTETGRKRDGVMRPWPWTVNMEGKGVWFDTEDEARAYVYKNYKRGARSFDVGCFQINYKWHGQNFDSIEEMFKPVPNAQYAAKFLLELYREKGSWAAAAGAYHSRTPKYANRYMKRFKSYRAALRGNDENSPQVLTLASVEPAPVPVQEPVVRVNRYPLLQNTGALPRLGSLVPLTLKGADRRLIEIGGVGG